MKQTQYRSMKMMMTLLCTALIALNSSLFISCQDKDIEREGLKLKAPDVSQITGQLSGDNYPSNMFSSSPTVQTSLLEW